MDWIDYGKSWRKFCGANLNVPGTRVVIDGETLVIGDINEQGGCCDCCCSYSGNMKDEVVERYAAPEGTP